MDVADLRKRILRELDRAKQDAGARRQAVDAAHAEFARVLARTIVPLLQQTVNILKAEGLRFQTFTPAESARLCSESSSQDFVEFELDPSTLPSRVIGRVSQDRGHRGIVVDEQPVGAGKSLEAIGDEDVLEFLLPALRRLITR